MLKLELKIGCAFDSDFPLMGQLKALEGFALLSQVVTKRVEQVDPNAGDSIQTGSKIKLFIDRQKILWHKNWQT